jgi:hypothetical protein
VISEPHGLPVNNQVTVMLEGLPTEGIVSVDLFTEK